MPRIARLVVIAVSVLSCAALAAVSSRPSGARAVPSEPVSPLDTAEGVDCIDVATAVRYGALGYDHRVVLTSTCEKSATCVVTASSNPDPQQVTVAAGATETVMIRVGSPATEFTATARCSLSD